jgi:Transmembrane domain of unknown function (DUF3566)
MPESPFPSVSTAPAQDATGEARDESGPEAGSYSEQTPSAEQTGAGSGAGESTWAAAPTEWRANEDWSAPSHVIVNGSSPWHEHSPSAETFADPALETSDAGHATASDAGHASAADQAVGVADTQAPAADPGLGYVAPAMTAAPGHSVPAPGGAYAAAMTAPPGPPASAGFASPQVGGVPGHARPQHRPAPPRGPRRARLQLRHIDPWTVLKFSCVLSVALFFVWLITIGVLYGVLDVTGAIGKINDAVTTINGTGSTPPITPGIVFGGAAIVGVVNIILFIALSTIGAVVYNLCADLVGGIEVTLAERET